jgi:hypothetical protein
MAFNSSEGTRVLVRKPVLKDRWVREGGLEVDKVLGVFVC